MFLTSLWFVVFGFWLRPDPDRGSTFDSPPFEDSLFTFPSTAVSMVTDHLNNIYLVTAENTIEKRSARGELLRSYSDKRYGFPAVDATDPMKIVAFDKDLDIMVALDNTLSPVGTINFQLLEGFRNPWIVGTASRGGLWVYDADEFRLKHIDDAGSVTMTSDDLSLEEVVVHPVSLIDRSGRIYLCDSSRGVLIFDSYLNYEKTIEARGVTYAEVIEEQLFYFADSAIHKLDLRTFEFSSVVIPDAGNLRAVSVQKGRLVLLYADRVEVRVG
jgi:hypothetical protein